MRQAEVYEWRTQGRSRYVVVVSNDDYSTATDPLCVGVVRTGPASPLIIPLADADPVGGRIVVGPVAPVPAGELAGPAGMLTGQTWDRVLAALRILFGT